MTADIVDFRSREPLKLEHAVGSPQGKAAVMLIFNRSLTPQELKFFEECCERTAFLMRGMDFK